MKIYSLENQFLKLTFNSIGAELKSCYSKLLSKELIYDGKSEYWNRSAPVLFPIVGKLKENQYFLHEIQFELSQHGFARNEAFDLCDLTNEKISFSLKASDESFKIYPFNFELIITYTLNDNKVETRYTVINHDSKEMPFSLGAHPGFVCPLFENESFDDYYLEFDKAENFSRYLLNHENGLFNGQQETIANQENLIELNYSYFEKDAIVFKNLNSKKIVLKSKKSNYCLEFSVKNFPYFGIWTKPNAPFICLEPWCGLADSENSSSNFQEKEGINSLKPKEEFERSFSFSITFNQPYCEH